VTRTIARIVHRLRGFAKRCKMLNFPSPHLPPWLMKMFFMRVISISTHGPKVLRSSSLSRADRSLFPAAKRSSILSVEFRPWGSTRFTSLRTV